MGDVHRHCTIAEENALFDEYYDGAIQSECPFRPHTDPTESELRADQIDSFLSSSNQICPSLTDTLIENGVSNVIGEIGLCDNIIPSVSLNPLSNIYGETSTGSGRSSSQDASVALHSRAFASPIINVASDQEMSPSVSARPQRGYNVATPSDMFAPATYSQQIHDSALEYANLRSPVRNQQTIATSEVNTLYTVPFLDIPSKLCTTAPAINTHNNGSGSSYQPRFPSTHWFTLPSEVDPCDLEQSQGHVQGLIPLWRCECGDELRLGSIVALDEHLISCRSQILIKRDFRAENEIIQWCFSSGHCVCGIYLTNKNYFYRQRHLSSPKHLYYLYLRLEGSPVSHCPLCGLWLSDYKGHQCQFEIAPTTRVHYFELLEKTLSKLISATPGAIFVDWSAIVSVMTPPRFLARGRFIGERHSADDHNYTMTEAAQADTAAEPYLCTSDRFNAEMERLNRVVIIADTNLYIEPVMAEPTLSCKETPRFKCKCGKHIQPVSQCGFLQHCYTDEHIVRTRLGDYMTALNEERIVAMFYMGDRCRCNKHSFHHGSNNNGIGQGTVQKRPLEKRVHLTSLGHLHNMHHITHPQDQITFHPCSHPPGACTGNHRLQNTRQFAHKFVRLVKKVAAELVDRRLYSFLPNDRELIESVMIPDCLSEFATAKRELDGRDPPLRVSSDMASSSLEL